MPTLFRQPGIVTLAFALVCISSGIAKGKTFDVWLDAAVRDEVDRVLKVAVENSTSEKQVMAPSGSGNSTSLIDTTSASDLVGIALNLAGLSGATEGEDDVTGTSATVSAYAIYSVINGFEPLSPDHYCDTASRRARAFSLTLGYDDGKKSESGEAVIVGAKVGIWPGLILGSQGSGNDACTADTTDIFDALVDSTGEFARFSTATLDRIAELKGVSPSDPSMFTLNNAANFDPLLAQHGDELERWVKSYFRDPERIKPFQNLDAETNKTIDDLTNGNKVALSLLTRQGKDGANDEYTAKLNWNVGIPNRPSLSFTANAGFEYQDIRGKRNSWGGMLAADLQLTPFHSKAVWGELPVRINLSALGKWMSRRKDIYKGQLSLTIPLSFLNMEGIEIPISVTVANRTEFIDETDVQGIVGFSIDTTKLFGLLDPLAVR